MKTTAMKTTDQAFPNADDTRTVAEVEEHIRRANLPPLDPGAVIQYSAIRYVDGYPAGYVQDFALAAISKHEADKAAGVGGEAVALLTEEEYCALQYCEHILYEIEVGRVLRSDESHVKDYRAATIADAKRMAAFARKRINPVFARLMHAMNTAAPTKEAEQAEAPSDNVMVHITHCNFGEYSGSCKYGDAENCPALSPSFSWIGKAIDKGNATHPPASGAGEREAKYEWCFYHPEHPAGHDGCQGHSVNADGRIDALIGQVRWQRQRADEAERMRDMVGSQARAALASKPEREAKIAVATLDNTFWELVHQCTSQTGNEPSKHACAALEEYVGDLMHTQTMEAKASIDRLADILRRTVNAIRGEPPESIAWGWKDLPERAAALATKPPAGEQKPYMWVYEWDSPHGMTRSMSSARINGLPPDRSVALYTTPQPEQVAQDSAEIAAWKWGYEYLQSRMESLERHGWAHDCDGEIQARVDAARAREGGAG